jgi:hypothetical protein
LKRCRYAWLLLVELALDFPPKSGINQTFVKQHAVFGKSHRRIDRGGIGQLRFGSRKSGKLIRCYQKDEVNAYRIELELHSRLLNKGRRERARQHAYELGFDIHEVAFDIIPRHLSFVRVDWSSLKKYVERRFGKLSNRIIKTAKLSAHRSLSDLKHFLRETGVNNVHRSLLPMKINKSINKALTSWALDFHDALSKSI